MAISKSHGRLHDVTIYHIKWLVSGPDPHARVCIRDYALANSLVPFINEDL